MKRHNWTKRVTILLAAAGMALAALSGYAAKPPENWPLQVEGVPVSREMYSYFLTEALIEAERDGRGAPKDPRALREDAGARCVAYVAVNSELRNRGVALSQQLKEQVASRTAYLWRVYQNYYSAMGVPKWAVNAAVAGRAARQQLFRALYDTGGARQTPEAHIKSYFYGNFAAYDGLRVFYTVTEDDGTERTMTPTERQKLQSVMNSLAAEANQPNGDLFTLAQDEIYAAAMGYAMPAIHVAQTQADLPAAQFGKVRALSPEKVAVLDLGDSLLVARGVNMRLSEEEYYQAYRDACLRALMGDEFEAALQELYQAFRADENAAAVDELLRGWDWNWGNN